VFRIDQEAFTDQGFVCPEGFADRSTEVIRAAMVYHYASTGTVERTPGLVTDFVTVR
jgi:hypothetical protein